MSVPFFGVERSLVIVKVVVLIELRLALFIGTSDGRLTAI